MSWAPGGGGLGMSMGGAVEGRGAEDPDRGAEAGGAGIAGPAELSELASDANPMAEKSRRRSAALRITAACCCTRSLLIARRKSVRLGNVQASTSGHCCTSGLPGAECQKPT